MRQNQITRKKSPHHRRSRAFKKAVSFLGISLILLSGTYVIAGLILNPRFFIADAKGKIGIVKGVMVSVRVIGEPGQPSITATAGCNALSSKVTLSWDETIDTTSYDVERDGQPLVTGLTETSYEDTTVDNENSYSYVVIAEGPRGSTASAPVPVETLDCTTLIPATCSIVTIGEKNVSGGSGTVSITDQTPAFTGTTNLPNAEIRIEITLADPTIVTLTANSNGYWSWTAPYEMAKELHMATVTATDPLYSWRTATDTKYFKIVSKEEEEEKKTKKTQEPAVVPPAPSIPTPEQPSGGPSWPLDIGVEVLNSQNIAYIGGELNLKTVISPKEISIPQELTLLYRIRASNKEDILFQQKETVNLENQDLSNFFHTLQLPVLLRSGQYIVSVQTTAGGSFISSETSFEVREVPLFSVGSLNVTWRMIMESVSWAILGLLLILLIFLGLLELEHHRAAKAIFQITENILAKKGYFTRRKGVSR